MILYNVLLLRVGVCLCSGWFSHCRLVVGPAVPKEETRPQRGCCLRRAGARGQRPTGNGERSTTDCDVVPREQLLPTKRAEPIRLEQ